MTMSWLNGWARNYACISVNKLRRRTVSQKYVPQIFEEEE
jgi:hypothetical protein